jgi:hypothetical protein
MASNWYTSNLGGNPNWITNINGDMSVDPLCPLTRTYTLGGSSYSTPFSPVLVRRSTELNNYRTDKTYQFLTKVKNHYSISGLSIYSSWGDAFQFKGTYSAGQTDGYFHFYSSPSSAQSTTQLTSYAATQSFGSSLVPTEGISSFNLYETDWSIQGFAYYRQGTSSTSLVLNSSIDSLGWCYYIDTDSYIWFDDNTSTRYPVGGGIGTKSVDQRYRSNNNLSRYIGYSLFNLTFNYSKIQGVTNDGIDIYLSQSKPNTSSSSFTPPSDSTFVGSLTMSGSTSSAFYGLSGNQYIIIVGRTTTTTSTIAISDVRIEGRYHSGNNRRYLTTNSLIWSNPTTISVIGLTGATYSAIVGTGNTVNATQSLSISQIFSKVGNGSFKSGVWENGVWNSGWRYDEGVYEFWSILSFFNHTRDKMWRFVVDGPKESVEQFIVGDKVAIGNIVAIDINEERKLLKNYFTIIAINIDDINRSYNIVVEVSNNFPLRRVQIDSTNHRITMTKNVWLSGGFFNGYFKGIWNYGLFKGYPLITEMYDSHWIDGSFDGGHFKSTPLTLTFSNTLFSPRGVLGITFSTPHKLRVGDIIAIDKTDKTVNPLYDGTATVTEVVNNYQIVTNKKFGVNPTQSETGTIYTSITSGLIQNFDFKSNNISTITSANSIETDAVFVYNSWVDASYSESSAVNIGKPKTLYNQLSKKSYSENNLYGFVTNDVLSSNSKFRDSYSLSEQEYKLGTKYKAFYDFIGQSSTFEDYFGPTGPEASLFINQGWTYSNGLTVGYSAMGSTGSPSVKFYRSVDSSEYEIVPYGNIRRSSGKELIVEAQGEGGILDISTGVSNIVNRVSQSIDKARYTMVEFDLVGYNSEIGYLQATPDTSGYFTYLSGPSYVYEPVIHFNNINYVNRNIYQGGVTYSNVMSPASYLPISQNINHLTTPNTKKTEYFYNKTSLSMHFRGSGYWPGPASPASKSTFILDNLKLYEVDMIPFFKYFIDININKSIQVPYQGLSPYIEYVSDNFATLDNISTGFESIELVSSNSVVSGVGIGISSAIGVSNLSNAVAGSFYLTSPAGGGRTAP